MRVWLLAFPLVIWTLSLSFGAIPDQGIEYETQIFLSPDVSPDGSWNCEHLLARGIFAEQAVSHFKISDALAIVRNSPEALPQPEVDSQSQRVTYTLQDGSSFSSIPRAGMWSNPQFVNHLKFEDVIYGSVVLDYSVRMEGNLAFPHINEFRQEEEEAESFGKMLLTPKVLRAILHQITMGHSTTATISGVPIFFTYPPYLTRFKTSYPTQLAVERDGRSFTWTMEVSPLLDHPDRKFKFVVQMKETNADIQLSALNVEITQGNRSLSAHYTFARSLTAIESVFQELTDYRFARRRLE